MLVIWCSILFCVDALYSKAGSNQACKNFIIKNLILIKLHKKNLKKLSYIAKFISITPKIIAAIWCHKQIARIITLKNPPIYYFAKNQLSKKIFGIFYLAKETRYIDSYLDSERPKTRTRNFYKCHQFLVVQTIVQTISSDHRSED